MSVSAKAGPRNHLYRTAKPMPRRSFWSGVLPFGKCERNHARDVPDELDLRAVLAWVQHHALDEAAQDLGCLDARSIVGEGFVQVSLPFMPSEHSGDAGRPG